MDSNLEQGQRTGRVGRVNISVIWEESDSPQSLQDVVRMVGLEGMERLIFGQYSNQLSEVIRWQEMKGVPRQVMIKVDDYHTNLRIQYVEAALVFGYSLALTQRLRDFESWLQAAMSESGLIGYEPTMLLDEKIVDDLVDAKRDSGENEAPGAGEETTLLNVDQRQLLEKFKDYLLRASSDRRVLDVVLSIPSKKRPAVLGMADLMFIKGVEAVISHFATVFPWMREIKAE